MYVFLLLLFSSVAKCVAMDPLTYEEYMDPNDPTSIYALVHDKADAATCESRLENDPSLRLILRRLFQKLNVDVSQRVYFTRTAQLTMSSYNMAVLADYLDSVAGGSAGTSELEQRERVRIALHDMMELIDDDPSVSRLTSFVTFIQPFLSIINLIVLPPTVFFVLKNILRARSFWLTMFGLIVVFSFVVTYYRIYQEKLSARLEASAIRTGDECAPPGWGEIVMDNLFGLVTFKRKSNCLKSIEQQMVSIPAEIDPFFVLSTVISNGIFGWLPTFGTYLNHFYRALFDGVPIPGMVIMSVTLIFFLVRIKTPLFTIEPLVIPLVSSICGAAVKAVLEPDEMPAAVEPVAPAEQLPLLRDANRPPLPAPSKSSSKGKNLALESQTSPATPEKDTKTFVTKRTPERQRNLERRQAAERRKARLGSGGAVDRDNRDAVSGTSSVESGGRLSRHSSISSHDESP